MLNGAITPVSRELNADLRSLRSGTHVFVTGIRDAVPKERKRRLKRLSETGSDANVIRHELAKTNRMAAQSPEAKNGISAACLTYSLDNKGGGSGETHGDVTGPLMPRQILHGIDVNKMMAPLLAANPNLKLVQTAFATSESNQADTDEHIDCKLQFNGANEHLAIVQEIGSINDYHLSMHDLSDGGEIVGQLRNPIRAEPHAFIWLLEQEPIDLGTFGGPFSNAFSINKSSQVVGTAGVPGSGTHAFLWDKNSGMKDLGTLGGRDSIARWINDNRQIVGTSFVGAGEPREDAERAFLWSPTWGMTNLGGQFEGWSRAIAINNAGVVLGWRLRGTVVCGFVWSPELGFVDIVGQGGRAFFPCAINDSGLVVGEGDDSAGNRRTFVWTCETGLRQIAVPDDFHPSDIDVHGTVIASIHSRPWHRPYLYSNVTGTSQALPFAEGHHTTVGRISRSGVILGAAWKSPWKHSHPLIWRLNYSHLSLI